MLIKIVCNRKKWLVLKDYVVSYALKMKATASESCLSNVVAPYAYVDEFIFIIAKVALIILMTTAWLKRGVSVVIWIKSRMRYNMKMDLR